MTSATRGYTAVVEQTQDAVLAALDTWTRAVQDVVGALPDGTPRVDPQRAVDQLFDVAGTVLQAQREVAHQVVRTSGAVVDTVRRTAGRATDAPEG